VSAALPGPAVETAEVVLPAAVIGEKAGTVLPALGPSVAMAAVMAPPGWARPDLHLLAALAAALAPDGIPAGARAGEEPLAARELFADLDLFLRTEGREETEAEPGELQLLAEASATNAAEGLHTAQLSWARYAHPEARLTVSPALAAALGVRPGDRVRVRSNWGQAELPVRLDAGLPEGVVTAPHRDPSVRGLLSWRREPVMRSLDLRPDRVFVEPLAEARGG
ncbi:MAG TPA: molybdopterin dinucleotide binding domain-containing protein, partial [Thermoanaerobaculia bacterium]|nr:molybdopterin dinucleotide binding domain-containing protein [Thermoanaerobaculia bacterium]